MKYGRFSFVLAVIAILVIIGGALTIFNHKDNDAATNSSSIQTSSAPKTSSITKTIAPIKAGTENARLLLVVNKKHPLPADYNPYNGSTTDNNADGSGLMPAADKAKTKLITAMQHAGFAISNNISGFRAYPYQKALYDNYVSSQGKEQADTFSARPGYSEHQSGLAFDLLGTDGQLPTNDAMYEWLQQHAHEYGFIIRYPRGESNITGYEGEEWHMRYIGVENATEMFNKKITTLEEFTGVPGGDYNQNASQDIAALNEYNQNNQHFLNPRK